MNQNRLKSLALIVIIYICSFWPYLQYGPLPLFSYWDEAFAIFGLALIVFKSRTCFKRDDCIFAILIIIFIILGFISNAITGYASISDAVSDMFINIKFFLVLAGTSIFFGSVKGQYSKNLIVLNLDIISILFLLIFVADKALGLFPVYEIRFGLKSEQLMFMHPSFCAAVVFFLLFSRIYFDRRKNVINYLLDAGLVIIILDTLRIKAIASVVIIMAIIAIMKLKNHRGIKIFGYIMTLILVVAVAYKQVHFYFNSVTINLFPRGVLLKTAVKIGKDYWPFGTGFGTFGSYISGVHYSHVYDIYSISNISGISRTEYNAITDQYWPMILGQTGLFGLIFMIIIWVILLKRVLNLRKKDTYGYLAGLASFFYILISSTSESSVCNPVCIPLAIILGLVFSKKNCIDKNEENK